MTPTSSLAIARKTRVCHSRLLKRFFSRSAICRRRSDERAVGQRRLHCRPGPGACRGWHLLNFPPKIRCECRWPSRSPAAAPARSRCASTMRRPSPAKRRRRSSMRPTRPPSKCSSGFFFYFTTSKFYLKRRHFSRSTPERALSRRSRHARE